MSNQDIYARHLVRFVYRQRIVVTDRSWSTSVLVRHGACHPYMIVPDLHFTAP
jgi:hypothetical protein